MKTGMNLNELAAEITRQTATKKDYLVPTTRMGMKATDSGVKLDVGVVGDHVGEFGITEIAHNQIGSHTEIPAKYYDRMLRENPELLATNVNTWLHAEKSTRMVRTLDGSARAFLSNRYRAIDNWMIAEAILPTVLREGGALGLRVESCNVTATRLHLKLVSERIAGTVVGEAVQAGVMISNSEVGLGSFSVEEFMLILSCTNGAVRPDAGMRKYHVGKRGAELENAFEVFADSTRKQSDKALMMQMNDVVKASFNGERFAEYLKTVSLTGDRKILSAPRVAVERVIEANGLPEGYTDGILASLLKSDDLTQWGLSNAVTEFCQTIESYEESTQMERIGGAILELDSEKFGELVAA